MSDWIHCNKCFKQPSANSDKFHLTNCGHFICATCTSEKPAYCFECESHCSTTILTPNLSEDIRCYFDNIDTQFDQLKRCLKAMEFQKNHRQKFFTHLFEENTRCNKELKNVLFKYNAAKEYIKKINGRNEDLQRENKRLKDIIKGMKVIKSGNNTNGIREIHNETPKSVINNSFFSDSKTSMSSQSLCFLATPTPSNNSAINLPFHSLFIQSKENNSRRRN